MYRIFSVDEANRLLPVVDERLEALQARIASVEQLRDRLGAMKPASVAARNAAVELEFLLRDVRDLKLDIDRLGVHLTSVEDGTVDIPAKVAGELVCLVHAVGDDEVTHYHRMTDDVALYPLGGAAAAPASSDATPSVVDDAGPPRTTA